MTTDTFVRIETLDPARRPRMETSADRPPKIPSHAEILPVSGEILIKAVPSATPDRIASQWEQAIKSASPEATFARRPLRNGDLVVDTTLLNGEARLWVREGRRYTWIAVWEGRRLQEPDEHELLKALLPTFK
jgi:hypothetical protein